MGKEKESRYIYRYNPLLQWGVIALIAYVILADINGGADMDMAEQPAQDQISGDTRDNTAAQRNIEIVSEPVSMKIGNIVEGEGEPARCGEKVTIRYTSFLSDGEVIEENAEAVFVIGEGAAGLERAAEGMKKGGIRQVMIPAALSHDDSIGDLGMKIELVNVKHNANPVATKFCIWESRWKL